MSFFTTSKRQYILTKDPTNKQIGPGKYSSDNTPVHAHSYAPFGSSVAKKKTLKSQQQCNNLGPGIYEIRGAIGKPSITKYQNEKCIIIKVNDQGSSQFRSQSKRFQNNVQTTPGPGQYHSEMNQKRSYMKSRSLSQQSKNMKDKILALNKQLYKSRQPTLISDDAKDEQLQRTIKKNYSSFQKSKGVVKWQLNRQQRFAPIIQQQLNENDRSEIIDKIKFKKKKTQKISNSAVFASQTVKSHFQSLIYQTNNQYKLEVKKIIGCKNTSPAPGSYEISKSMGKKPNKFYPYQFFGSTVARFPDQEVIVQENEDNITPGPGYYMKQPIKTAVRQKRIKTQPTDNYQQRSYSYVDLQKNVPGPGSYHVQNSSFKTRKANDCFGSHQPRFSLDKPNNQPKKVQFYALTTKQNRLSGKTYKYPFNKPPIQQKLSSNFKSNIDRDCFQDQKQRKNIPFGQYDVCLNDISTKIKKYNQLVQQLSNCHLSRPPFLSSMQRFKEDDKQEQNVHGNCWCLAKSIEKQCYQPVSSFFKSQSKRIQTFDQKAKSPPVGSYNQNSSLIKNSFNTKFFKNSVNQGKKIACWKPSH